jgi:DNA-binding transcriptional LysR family regulator
VRRLEAELGLALLQRTPHGIELTAAGTDLLARAETVLAEVARARAEMDQHAGAERGVVRVAAPAGDAVGLAQALVDFHREHPGIRITLRQGSAPEVVGLVRRGAADVAVVSLPAGAAEPGLSAEPLAEEPLRLLVATGDPLAGGGPARLWDVRDRPWILAERGTAVRELVVGACQEAGFSPVPLWEAGDPGTIRFLVHAGIGVSVVPLSWLGQPGAHVEAVALAEPAPRHRMSLLAPAAGLTPAAALLHARLRGALGGPA